MTPAPSTMPKLTFALPKKHTRNILKTVESNTKHFFPSDHSPVIARVKIKPRKKLHKQKDTSNTWKSDKKQEEGTLKEFVKEVKDHIESTPSHADANDRIKILNDAWENVAEKHVEPHAGIKRGGNLSADTKNRIELRQSKKNAREVEDVKELTKKIGRSIAKERRHALKENLEDCIWHDIKNAKSGFVPSHVKLKHKDGRVAKSSERPEILAEFFRDKQWGTDDSTNDPDDTLRIFRNCSEIRTGHFTTE